MSFASPWLLLLLLLVPLAWWWAGRASRRPAAMYSSVDLVLPLRRTLRQRVAWLPQALLVLGTACVIIGLARPQRGIGEVRTSANGVALMMVVDRSASMGLPMRFGNQRGTRLDVVKHVFKEFVVGNDAGLKGRPEDLVGLVTFARYPDTVCPLVTIHDTLVKLVDAIELAADRWEGGTAIGDGLALGAARLKKAEEELATRNKDDPDPAFKIKSKALIMLTDGDENYGDTTADQSAQLCKEWGIKIYAIGVGDDRGGIIDTPAGQVRVQRGGGFDEALMKRITALTGGDYWRATDGEALRRAYEKIDELEKTEIKKVEYTSYEEAFVPFAIAGAGLISLGLFLSTTWLRRAP